MPVELPLPRMLGVFGLGLNTFIVFLVAAAAVFMLASSKWPASTKDGDSVLTWSVLAGAAGARVGQQLVGFGMSWGGLLGWLRADELHMSFVAGILCGTVVFAYLGRRRHLDVRASLDLLAPALVLAYGVGRLGSGALGRATTVPWAVQYAGVSVHPVAIYSLAGAGLAALLLRLLPGQQVVSGARYTIALIFVGLWRSLVEFFTAGGKVAVLSSTQWSYLGLAAFAFLLYRLGVRLSVSTSPAQPQPARRWAATVLTTLLVVLVLSNAALAALWQPGSTRSTEERPVLSYRAPDFEAKTLNGKTLRLSRLRGRVVILNFWASWCPPCRSELPELEAVHDEWGDQATILGIDLGEEEDTVRRFLETQAYSWTFVVDGGSVADLYRVKYLPTTFFLDRNGIIHRIYTGPMTRDELLAFLREAGM